MPRRDLWFSVFSTSSSSLFSFPLSPFCVPSNGRLCWARGVWRWPPPCRSLSSRVPGSSVGAPSWTSGPGLNRPAELGAKPLPRCLLHATLPRSVATEAGGRVWFCPQDLQDHNDELQAALEGLRAQLPPSRHSLPHTQLDGQLPPGHSPAGRCPLLGGVVLCPHPRGWPASCTGAHRSSGPLA